MANEIVLYQPNEQFQLEVRVQDETVWLNRNQMALLFDRDVKTIGKHINNALREELAPTIAKNATVASVGAKSATTQRPTGAVNNKTPYEEQNQVVAKFATTAADGKVYQVEYYSLDVILSVGYRVKSSRGIEFRRWANRILKEYVLRGHAVNQRLIEIEDRIDRRLQEHTDQIHELQDKVDFFVRTSLPPVEQVFYNGQFFEARVLLERIIKTAQKRVIIIDAYVDATTFEMLDVRAKGIKATVYSGKDLDRLRDLHNAKTDVEPIETFVWRNASHDRWLIADNSVYHCGHSLKDMGQKLSAVSLLGVDAEDILKQVR